MCTWTLKSCHSFQPSNSPVRTAVVGQAAPESPHNLTGSQGAPAGCDKACKPHSDDSAPFGQGARSAEAMGGSQVVAWEELQLVGGRRVFPKVLQHIQTKAPLRDREVMLPCRRPVAHLPRTLGTVGSHLALPSQPAAESFLARAGAQHLESAAWGHPRTGGLWSGLLFPPVAVLKATGYLCSGTARQNEETHCHAVR